MKQIDKCAEPKKDQSVIARRRELDNTIYAFTCKECGCSWKVYQNQYHAQDCSWK